MALCLYILDNYLSLNAVFQTVFPRLGIGWSALRLLGMAVRPPQHGPRMATGMGSLAERREFFTGGTKLPDGFWACASALLMAGHGWFPEGRLSLPRQPTGPVYQPGIPWHARSRLPSERCHCRRAGQRNCGTRYTTPRAAPDQMTSFRQAVQHRRIKTKS